MGYLFGQKRRKVGRLQRQAARCFLVTQEASSVELGTWCWPRVVLIENRFEGGDIDAGLEIYIDAVSGVGSWKNYRSPAPNFPGQCLDHQGDGGRGKAPGELPRIGSSQLPVLLVGGENRARYGQILTVIEPCLKQRERVTIPNASHGMHRMNPAAFNSSVAQFLSTH